MTPNPLGWPGFQPTQTHFKPELKIAGVWQSVGDLVFFEKGEAEQYARDMYGLDFRAEDHRSIETCAPATHTYSGYRCAIPIK